MVRAGAARFGYPIGVAVDTTGTVYVADFSNSTIRRITPSGVVTTLAGLALSAGNADGVEARRGSTGPKASRWTAPARSRRRYREQHDSMRITPAGVVQHAGRRFQVPERRRGGQRRNGLRRRHVQQHDSNDHAGSAVSTLAGLAGSSGSVDGVGSAARFNAPRGIAVDSGGTVYVADQFGDTIRTITAGGVVSTLAGSAGMRGSADGTGGAARFYRPGDVAVDAGGTLYVADSSNNTVRQAVFGTPASPTISTQPAHRTVVAGQNTSFTVAASGNPIPGSQWQVSTNAGTSWTDLTDSAPYSGTTATTLLQARQPVWESVRCVRAAASQRWRAVATLTVYVRPRVRVGARREGLPPVRW